MKKTKTSKGPKVPKGSGSDKPEVKLDVIDVTSDKPAVPDGKDAKAASVPASAPASDDSTRASIKSYLTTAALMAIYVSVAAYTFMQVEQPAELVHWTSQYYSQLSFICLIIVFTGYLVLKRALS